MEKEPNFKPEDGQPQRPDKNHTPKPLSRLARVMREAARREGVDPKELLYKSNLKLQEMLADRDPDEAEKFHRLFDIPHDHKVPTPDNLQHIFELPSPPDEQSNK